MADKKFNQKEFDEFILDNEIIGFFNKPIKLKSGRVSNWYVNWRNVAEDVFKIDKLADYVLDFTADVIENPPNCFYGVPEGATKLGIITQYKHAFNRSGMVDVILPMGRGKAKEHGDPKDKYFVGQPVGGTIILEDVTTTGGSLLKTIDQLIEVGVPILAAFGLTNRMELTKGGESVEEAVNARNVNYYSLSNAIELLPQAYKKLNPGKQIADAIENEFQKYGVEKLSLK